MIEVSVDDVGSPKTYKIPEEYIVYFDNSLEQHILCSSCRAPLFDVIKTRDSDRVTKITSSCPHCGDKSFQVTINGEFLFGNTDYSVYGEVDIIKITTSHGSVNYCEAVVHPRKVKQYGN